MILICPVNLRSVTVVMLNLGLFLCRFKAFFACSPRRIKNKKCITQGMQIEFQFNFTRDVIPIIITPLAAIFCYS